MPLEPESTATSVAVVEPGRDAFQGDERLKASIAPTLAQVVMEVAGDESKSAAEKILAATASFDAGRQANEVVGAVPAMFKGTHDVDDSSAVAAAVEASGAPRNLIEKQKLEAAREFEKAQEPVIIPQPVDVDPANTAELQAAADLILD